MAPLRIAYITNHRRFKIHFRAYPWAQALAARGHTVDVFCHADTARWRTQVEQADGFRIVHNPDLLIGPLRQGWDPYCALRRYRFLAHEAQPYDLIHCLDTRLAVIWPALAYARPRGIPVFSDWIDWWGRGGLIAERRPRWYQLMFGGIETWFEEHYRPQLDGLTAISQALIERAVALGVPRDSCLHLPGGANLAAFQDLPAREDARAALGLPPDAEVLCFSGLDVLIDLPLAIDAFAHIARQRPRAWLLLVGPTPEAARRLAPDDATRARIHATGPVPYAALGRHLAAADCFLMPYADKVSNVGRWPNKVGDYMCVGRPTISNPVGEVARLFEAHPIGVLTPPAPEAMAAAAQALLNDSARRMQMGQAARATAEAHYAWDVLIDRLEAWYHARLAARLPRTAG